MSKIVKYILSGVEDMNIGVKIGLLLFALVSVTFISGSMVIMIIVAIHHPVAWFLLAIFLPFLIFIIGMAYEDYKESS